MMSIDDATPEEWDRSRARTITGKLYHPEDKHHPVTKPQHYNKGGIEAIDYIKQQLGPGFGDYCAGNVMKYLHRFKYKNGVEDLKKAQVYLNWLIEDQTN
jgi:hypothetical protein